MAAVTDLQAAPLLLSLLFRDHPKLALIQAIAWLDPLSLGQRLPDEDLEFDYDDEDELVVGLHVCRQCFPGVYSGANHLLMQGIPELDVKRYLCEGINAHLVTPLQTLEDLRYGPPLDCYGINPELVAECDQPSHPVYRSRAVLALLGVTVGDGTTIEDWSRGSAAADVIRYSLERCAAPVYQDVGALLAWLFSASGNSLVDWSRDEMWESGSSLPEWTPNDIDFVNEMSREADEMMASAIRGLDTLEQDAALRKVLVHHLKTVFKYIDKKGNTTHARAILSDDECATFAKRLVWPERDGECAASQADHDPRLLPLRDHPAPPAG